MTAPAIRELGQLAVLGSTNLDFFAAALGARAADHGIALQTQVPDFGTARMELLRPADQSPLKLAMAQGPAATVIVERAEDCLAEALLHPLSITEPEAYLDVALEPLMQLIASAREALPGPLLVFSLVAFQPPVLGLADAGQDHGAGALIAKANARLAAAVAEMADTYLLDAAAMLAEVGRAQADPGEFWHMARAPFSETFARHAANKVLGALLNLRGMTARMLVIDMDNTLWGGVLGEDGIEGIQIGGAYPGSAYRSFQQALRALADRGIALTLASKNDQDLALQALADHPEMALRPDDFVTHRINWTEKAINISEMLDEIALGPASCMFIDDNPVERGKVQGALPEVIVPDFPDSPAQLANWLLTNPFLECLQLTSSDIKRSAQYKTRVAEKTARAAFDNLDDFYRHLEMKLTIEPFGKTNRQRVLQLFQKTNQFNVTTRRHDATALDAIIAEGGHVFAIGAEDRNLPYELMGVLVLRDDAAMAAYADDPMLGAGRRDGAMWVDSFLLSCRILGRTLENAVLAWATGFAKSKGANALLGQVINTKRNTPARGVFEGTGFARSHDAGEDGALWLWDLAGGAAEVPDYFDVIEKPADAAPSPLTTKPNPLATKPNPLVTKPNPLATKPNPLATKANPLATKPNPLATKANPLATGGNPLATGPATQAAKPSGDTALEPFFRGFFKLDDGFDLQTADMDTVPGWDSMAHVRLIMELEINLGRKLPVEAAFTVKSFVDLEKALAA